MEYARGPHLASDLQAQSFPHPFDSHPALGARMAAVGVRTGSTAVANVVMAAPAETWFSEIGEAERIESTLWTSYEARFQAAHDQSLAYRYLPSTPEEKAHVERFFPPLEFAGKDGGVVLTLDCDGFRYQDWAAPVGWGDIVKVQASDNSFTGKVLTVKTAAGSVKLPLRKVAEKNEVIEARINAYYGRYRAALENQQHRLAS